MAGRMTSGVEQARVGSAGERDTLGSCRGLCMQPVHGELLSMMVNVGPKPPRDRYRTFTGISYASLCIVVQLEQRAPLLIQIKTTRYKPMMPFIMLGSVVQVHP